MGIGSSSVDANGPGLFDLPEPERPLRPERSRRGRNRETWARTATAKVTIIDAEALREAAARVDDQAVMTGVEDSEAEGTDVMATNDAFDALAWLIWPTDGWRRRWMPALSGSSRWPARSRPSPLTGARSPGR